ncbi:Uncharacterised protein [Candidatus Venteria ishoeyi]|uniref:Uncharacterized protein n=1 Tax=Candidatus Venteria ishoeyi TaxID=1899563 RepID=A0A1H6F863_9GAMM|nr:Uncharacterised protein [Candidatus Venteria ishoeyi]
MLQPIVIKGKKKLEKLYHFPTKIDKNGTWVAMRENDHTMKISCKGEGCPISIRDGDGLQPVFNGAKCW